MVFNLYFTNTNDSWMLLGSNMTTSQIKVVWRSKSTLLLTQAAGACGCVRDGSQGCCRWRKGSCQVLRQLSTRCSFCKYIDWAMYVEIYYIYIHISMKHVHHGIYSEFLLFRCWAHPKEPQTANASTWSPKLIATQNSLVKLDPKYVLKVTHRIAACLLDQNSQVDKDRVHVVFLCCLFLLHSSGIW